MIVVLLLLIFKLNSAHIEDYHDFDMDHQTPAPDGVLVFGFSGQFQIALEVGTPSQLLQVKLSIEDDSIYLFNESCAYTNMCNQNKSLIYFQSSHSTTFFTEHKTFDGSIMNRPGPTGIIARDTLNFAGQTFIHDFGLVDKSWFKTQGDGVIGLGVHPEYNTYRQSFIFHLLQRFRQRQIGIKVLRNHNVSIQNSGVVSIGGKLPMGCYHDKYYDYATLQYPGKQWIFTLQSASYDYIAPSNQKYSATIRPGQYYSIGPDTFLDQFYEYIHAIQPDSRIDDYYIQREDGPAPPELQFDVGTIRLTLLPRDYLSEKTPLGRMVLFKKRSRDYAGLNADWVFGDNFLQRYCVILEYSLTDPRIGFTRTFSQRQIVSNFLIISLVFVVFIVKMIVK